MIVEHLVLVSCRCLCNVRDLATSLRGFSSWVPSALMKCQRRLSSCLSCCKEWINVCLNFQALKNKHQFHLQVGQNVQRFPLYVGKFHEWVGQCPSQTDILRHDFDINNNKLSKLIDLNYRVRTKRLQLTNHYAKKQFLQAKKSASMEKLSASFSTFEVPCLINFLQQLTKANQKLKTI